MIKCEMSSAWEKTVAASEIMAVIKKKSFSLPQDERWNVNKSGEQGSEKRSAMCSDVDPGSLSRLQTRAGSLPSLLQIHELFRKPAKSH
jgi:hypothetical protein